jgi:23S rRNA (adenine-N6)-dimethyltransferase
VADAGVSDRDLVVEIGAGTGSLTRPLLQRARRVIAIELDPACAAFLRQDLGHDPRLTVMCANALRAELPREAFRVIGNLPFGSGTRILRRILDDPRTALTRADVLIQHEAARKRAQVAPSTLATLRWSPWWDFRLVRIVRRDAFAPPPSVDAGLLVIERRPRPLLRTQDRAAYIRLVSRGFARANTPVRRVVDVPSRSWAGFARARGVPMDARATELDVFDWVALFARAGGQR